MKANKYLVIIAMLFILPLFVQTAKAAEPSVAVLCYHDVADKVANEWTVTPKNLREQFEYLRRNGYTPISLATYQAAIRGEAVLPEKPVMLTFDDGYISFYTKIFPLLQEYQYPAMMALVTSWLDYPPPGLGELLSWDQIREMDKSGLITFASHSHQSHRFIVASPQGDVRPMTEMRQYRDGKYETTEGYIQRVRSDLQESQKVFVKELGHKAEAIVWPFGAYTQIGVNIAYEEGFVASLILFGGDNLPNAENLKNIKRGIIINNPNIKEFAKFLQDKGKDKVEIRAAQLDLDSIYVENNPEQTEQNLTDAIVRLSNANVNTVFLQAFNDSEGDGNIKSVYFATKAAPVKADLFGHAAMRIILEADCAVYAWMPTLSGQWLTENRPEDAVKATASNKKGWYNRATPFSPVVEKRLLELYGDLAAYSFIDGILFQDDLYFNDFEDFSPSAKAAFKRETGLDLTPEVLSDPKIRARWTAMKTDALTNLTKKLAAEVRVHRPDALIARNIYATLVTEPESQEWFAQNYEQYLNTYDYTVIMAYPYMEGEEKDPSGWLKMLVQTALKNPGNAEKTVFKLQTYNWKTEKWIPSKELKTQVDTLKRYGAKHIGYYPEGNVNAFREPAVSLNKRNDL